MSAVDQRPADGRTAAAAQPIRRYAALGDSFTAGTGCGPGESWADRLASILGNAVPGFVYRNLAVEGATSERVLEQLEPALELGPDLVTVVCGANDVLFSIRPDVSAYRRRLSALFSRLRRASSTLVVVTATAPERWDFLELGPRTRARLERGLVEFNRATRVVAADFDVPCLAVADHPGIAEPENFTFTTQKVVTTPRSGSSTCSVVGTPSVGHEPRGGSMTLPQTEQRSPRILFSAMPRRNRDVASPAVNR